MLIICAQFIVINIINSIYKIKIYISHYVRVEFSIFSLKVLTLVIQIISQIIWTIKYWLPKLHDIHKLRLF